MSKSETCNLPPFEAHFASTCVAIIFGVLGGKIAMLFLPMFDTWLVVLLALGLGFLIPWVVCQFLFKTAHAWYGSHSIQHRIYDGIGIAAAGVAFII